MCPWEGQANLKRALKCVAFRLSGLIFFHSRSDAKKEVRTDLAVQWAYVTIDGMTLVLGETSQTSAALETHVKQLVNSIPTICQLLQSFPYWVEILHCIEEQLVMRKLISL